MWYDLRSVGNAFLSVLLLALAAQAARAAVIFQFTYFDPPGVGFNDPALGPARRAALETTAA